MKKTRLVLRNLRLLRRIGPELAVLYTDAFEDLDAYLDSLAPVPTEPVQWVVIAEQCRLVRLSWPAPTTPPDEPWKRDRWAQLEALRETIIDLEQAARSDTHETAAVALLAFRMAHQRVLTQLTDRWHKRPTRIGRGEVPPIVSAAIAPGSEPADTADEPLDGR